MRAHAAGAAIPKSERGAAIALGNFDGVHRGHQVVIESARKAAASLNAPLGVAVFAPHPRRVFAPDSPPFRLQSRAQRARALEALGVDELYEIGFDRALAQSSDAEFAEHVLHQQLGVKHVSIGADFRFGRGRMGDAASLAKLGERFGFSVDAVSLLPGAEDKVSSSAIRTAIAAGDMGAAADLLSRPGAIEGEVQRGFARGRGFGIATANVPLGDYVRPDSAFTPCACAWARRCTRASPASASIPPSARCRSRC
ncbi:MAG: adenylyltransferase/cytidyltransferase family protein [Hyphomonadaceae bacterium]